MLDWSSGVMSRANFCNFLYSLQQLLKYAEFMEYDVLSWLQKSFVATFYCNFYQVGQLRKMQKFYLKKHASELFQYSYVLFHNRFESNSDLKTIVEMTRPSISPEL